MSQQTATDLLDFWMAEHARAAIEAGARGEDPELDGDVLRARSHLRYWQAVRDRRMPFSLLACDHCREPRLTASPQLMAGTPCPRRCGGTMQVEAERGRREREARYEAALERRGG